MKLMPSTFDQAVVEMRDTVGPDHVLLGSEALARHSRDTIPWRRICSAVVYPASRDEVCAVVKIANRHGLPVWTFSKGKNWGYGASMAAGDGAIIVILERISRIVDRRLASRSAGVAYLQMGHGALPRGLV